MFLTHGDSDRLTGKGAFVMRSAPEGERLSMDVALDGKVAFGDLTPDLLAALESQLSEVFMPLLAESHAAWGQLKEGEVEAFRADVSAFAGSLGDTLRNIGGGIELEQPPPQYDLEEAAIDVVAYSAAHPDLVRNLETLLESWCDDIEAHLSEQDEESMVTDRVGPRGIIEFWRIRTQKLASIVEQTRSRSFRQVITVMTQMVSRSGSASDHVRSTSFTLLRRWKTLDVSVTEAANEARDNVKYLSTLEKFIEPLYTQTPPQIVDALPALMNSIKMVFHISRYFGNDRERMQDLFQRITAQMIARCCKYILAAGGDVKQKGTHLWSKDPTVLLHALEQTLRLNEALQDTYRFTKEALAAQAQVKQFTFDEQAIFGRMELFARRTIKLMDLSATRVQFAAIATHQLEGMGPLVEEFKADIQAFQAKKHDLLAFEDNNFDRDYVEFNVQIQDLEGKLQAFINSSFERVANVMRALRLLKKFQSILQRESLKAELAEKYALVFATYYGELEVVRALYEKHRLTPPVPRNLPPVAGNIAWARHLLKRIEAPMKEFEQQSVLLASKDSRRVIKAYNRIARTLVAFEYLWYQAWVDSVEVAKGGLQATLIVRHPEDGKLYVNFDSEIAQLIREAKCLDRMGIEVPEAAKTVLLQEEKFKAYYAQLTHALHEYARITNKIIPVTAQLLRPAVHDLEYKLRPGMVTLTWTSMNIDSYIQHVMAGLRRLEELVCNINDVIENRVEKNLKTVSQTLLLELPEDAAFTLDDFVSLQQDSITKRVSFLQGKNLEVENAVEDLLSLIVGYPLDPHIAAVKEEDILRLREHYNHFFFSSLLACIKSSLNALKRRVSSRMSSLDPAKTAYLGLVHPFFEVDLKLLDTYVPGVGGAATGAGEGPPGSEPAGPRPSGTYEAKVALSPSLGDVQRAITRTAHAVLHSTKELAEWGQGDVPEEDRVSFFQRVGRDIEVVRVALLLTGSVQSLKDQVAEYLASFDEYSWLWEQDVDESYAAFIKGGQPGIEQYEGRLKHFKSVALKAEDIADVNHIGALSLQTAHLKQALAARAHTWKARYAENLHKATRAAMGDIAEYIKTQSTKVTRPVDTLDSLRFVMNTLVEVREKESVIENEIRPVMQVYDMLESYMPPGYMSKDEQDLKTVLQSSWGKLVDRADKVQDSITSLQGGFRKELLSDVRAFVVQVEAFWKDYERNGPMVQGLAPEEAMDRLKRFEDKFEIMQRKAELYQGGEQLFALPITEYPLLEETRTQLQLLSKLYTLYRDVMGKMGEFETILWADVVKNIDTMTHEMDSFFMRCKKMPKRLRTWDAYKQLRGSIEDFQTVLPLLHRLSADYMQSWHWEELSTLVGKELSVYNPEFRLKDLVEANLVDHADDIEALCHSAQQQMAILQKLDEIEEKWRVARFSFTMAADRKTAVPLLQNVPVTVEELEESQLQLQTMLTARHIGRFKGRAQDMLKELSDTSETLELWIKVQSMWSSLEAVFLKGDIPKQMPRVARRFARLDTDFVRNQASAHSTDFVLPACANEVLKTSLPGMFEELENCQKSLFGYLETKRNLFPRFYFVSDPVLLKILSQGSEPQAIQEYYSKLFDAISRVEHDRKDKNRITKMMSRLGNAKEEIELRRPVVIKSNIIEEWLHQLLTEMRRTMKDEADDCATEIAIISSNIENRLRGFVNESCGQYALLGIQLLWTSDMEAALAVGSRGALKGVKAKHDGVQADLSRWCLTDLGSKLNRIKIETLVTIQVHQTQIIDDFLETLKANRGMTLSPNMFDWLKQCRFYSRADEGDDVSPDGSIVISVTDVDFKYQYEYLGCKERLVITQLTDRCYITLAQAYSMYFGGAPAGPAGTGKTETVKDMGRTLGLYVVVTNCSSEMRYTDCAKIFKGLCQAGLWGCFDEFNRITLPVLSVVAQQVQAVLNARRAGAKQFAFPGDAAALTRDTGLPNYVTLNPICGFYITMNPGYAGRQELPENLKALFRSVAMMVPDREAIIKVKLVTAGYSLFSQLSKKFFTAYFIASQQLSNQRHYDFGLRNILSVLRTAGATKRDNLDVDEYILLYRTLRDMNLSKLVAQDVPLFLSMLRDLFPGVAEQAEGATDDLLPYIESALRTTQLVPWSSWVSKVKQLNDTNLVRHALMVIGPSGGGKSAIFNTLARALQEKDGQQYRITRMNPKSVAETELYGETDINTGEWTVGIFSSIFERANRRDNAYISWLIMDGPVDTMWIESLNSVMDDNKLLTLPNGDRFAMSEKCRLLFEAMDLRNASPATVSRSGIVYVSDVDLDWKPVTDAWIAKQAPASQALLTALFRRHVGQVKQDRLLEEAAGEDLPDADTSNSDYGHLFDFMYRGTKEGATVQVSRVSAVLAVMNLMDAYLHRAQAAGNLLPGRGDEAAYSAALQKLFLWCLAWGIGGLLEEEDRARMDAYLRKRGAAAMPDTASMAEGETIFEWYVDVESPRAVTWKRWEAPRWDYPTKDDPLDFSNLLVPNMDSTRHIALIKALHDPKSDLDKGKPVLLVGGPGTAKTSTALMFFATFDASKRLLKRINFSSATTPQIFQGTIEDSLDKRGGRSFGPPSGKRMTVFLDDLSMPEINQWGDQPCNEIVRQLIETSGFYFRDRERRGDFKVCEDLSFVGAMNHPGAGRNDIPDRLKRHFFLFNMVAPSIQSIDDLYGQMLHGRFKPEEFSAEALGVVDNLTSATIDLWRLVKQRMLPTPAKHHYIFNMRDLSRVFQGILLTPKASILTGGLATPSKNEALNLLKLWHHECARVFSDKLINNADKQWYNSVMDRIMTALFGEDARAAVAGPSETGSDFVNFLRDAEVDPETDEVLEEAPLIYEDGGSLANIRERVEMFMAKHNTDHPAFTLELVLFDDALRHLVRITRIMATPGGSALLVGVGGSGKQSLARLAAYICRATLRRIQLTKSYGLNQLKEDLKEMYKLAGHQRQSVAFLFTDTQIRSESFLEAINSLLMTGEVSGLFTKEEMLQMTGELRQDFLEARPGMEDNPDNLRQYFFDLARDNLHVVLCMSPVDPRFRERARKFPGLISGCTIDWFLEWPEEALVAVSRGFLSEFPLDTDAATKEAVIAHMGFVHTSVNTVCDEYVASSKRRVYQTPKSYLSFIRNFKHLYSEKIAELREKESRVNKGLAKLEKGAEDVEAMKHILAEERRNVEAATAAANEKLTSVDVQSKQAQRESEVVARIKADCEAEAERISRERDACQADLAKAQPFVVQAEEAIASISRKHVQEITMLSKPPDVIRVVMDGVLILFQMPLVPLKLTELSVQRQPVEFITPSWAAALQMMAETRFVENIKEFERDRVLNEEMVELLTPYTEWYLYDPEVAGGGSVAARGLCVYVRAMRSYFLASKIVKPKLEALEIAEAQLDQANRALADAQSKEEQSRSRLAGLKAEFDGAVAHREEVEKHAQSLQRRMEQASSLIQGLDEEKVRWMEDSNTFADVKRRLVGDCAVACAFVSYLGAFNQPFREYLIADKFVGDCKRRGIAVTGDLSVSDFLVDISTIGDWNLDGLPTDTLSVENGILVTRSTRYPLLVDPQGQALHWIKNKERARLPVWETTALNSARLKHDLKETMQWGKTMIVVGVEENIDPMLDPVLEKQVITSAGGLVKQINVADDLLDYSDDFKLFFITRLPNPHFSPELQAKTTVVDFTVTQSGLEEQLLGRVVTHEERALEDLLQQVLEDANDNTKALMALDDQLLSTLTTQETDLLENEELVDVLANTKAKSQEVKEKLAAADTTRHSIKEKREVYRPVATRGAVLYFAIVEMSLVNVMYQTSLAQFITLFMKSMQVAEKATVAAKRVQKIIDTLTELVWRYINKGLYEADKLLFVSIITIKILVTDGILNQGDVGLFLRGGAALEMSTISKRKPEWIKEDDVWKNVIALSQGSAFFRTLPDDILRNELAWAQWFNSAEPEESEVPEYQMRMQENKDTGAWLRLLLIRAMRVDRTLLVMRHFVRATEEMGPRYVEPVTDTIESVYESMDCSTPVVFLLSVGSDPTDSIEHLAKRKKQSLASVSMGQGQEQVAERELAKAAVNGTWVLLQNCELALELMNSMEGRLHDMVDSMHEDFRLFITALPHKDFPLGLLQMSTKVTQEPPSGLRAGLLRSYRTIIDQDRLERIDTPSQALMWRKLMYGLAFMHSIVQERRKFGALGWCVPYEFNTGDLSASLTFLEKHLYGGPISWKTLQFMIAEVQYGGKVTDDMDRRLLATYVDRWITPGILKDDFQFTPASPLSRFESEYAVPDSMDMDYYRQYILAWDDIDPPEVFGLHPTADLSFRNREAAAFLGTLADTQPTVSSGAGASSGAASGGADAMQAEITQRSADYEKRLPDHTVYKDENVIRALSERGRGGLAVPLNIFAFQETQRLFAVIDQVKNMLENIAAAQRGDVVITAELQDAMTAIYSARVPHSWVYTATADEFSWRAPSLSNWFESLTRRDAQMRDWLAEGRPPAFWMTGFFNPQGFLTAMKQEVTQAHRSAGWSLENMEYIGSVTEYAEADQVMKPPAEGVFVYGLHMDGAQWDADERALAESGKELFPRVPVMHVSAMPKVEAAERLKTMNRGSATAYLCPVYKYASRTDLHLVFCVHIPSRLPASHWILRGVAMTCNPH